jgi:hypothetical protein
MGTEFSLTPSVFSCQYHATAVPCLHIYQLGVGQRARQRHSSTETVTSHHNSTSTIIPVSLNNMPKNLGFFNPVVGIPASHSRGFGHESGHISVSLTEAFYSLMQMPSNRPGHGLLYPSQQVPYNRFAIKFHVSFVVVQLSLLTN